MIDTVTNGPTDLLPIGEVAHRAKIRAGEVKQRVE